MKKQLLLMGALVTALATETPTSLRAEPTNTVTIVNDITNNTTWFNTNVYLMDGFVHVLAPAELTIQPGTIIKGLSAGSITTGESAAALFITAGAKIHATGTPAKPIIFTTEFDDTAIADDMGIYDRGLWGGVIVMGQAVLNTASDTTGNTNSPKYDVFEGLPDNTLNGQHVYRFGGTNDADNSGEIQYVSIRHGGFAFLANKELNGLSMCALGNGTTIDHVEAYAIADDGFEFFGGTVNTKYLVSAFNDDDAFDTDQGYRGKNQFWFSIQEDGKRDNGGEWNGEPNGIAVSNAPISNFQLYNATFIGAGNAGTNTTANHGLTIREYSSPRVYNSILTDFTTAHGNGSVGLRIADVRSQAMLTAGLMDLRENIIAGFGTAVTNAASAILLADASRSNSTVNPLLTSISRVNDHTLDPRLATSSPALSTTLVAPNDGFYTPVSYKGAFDKNNLWVQTWTALDTLGYLPSETVITPAAVVAPNPATLSIAPAGGNLEITYPSQNGYIYQLQSATNLTSPVFWADEGSALAGTGGTLTHTVPTSLVQKYFRVSAQ